jgi:hypothetical protein
LTVTDTGCLDNVDLSDEELLPTFAWPVTTPLLMASVQDDALHDPPRAV